MRRRLRLTTAMWSAALLLALAAAFWVIYGATPAFAGPRLSPALAPLDGTPTVISSPIPVTVPSISSGSGSITAAAPSNTAVVIVLSLSCVTTIIGLIIAIVTWRSLMRGGYGPFLRALLLGAKATRGQSTDPNAAHDSGGSWDASHTLNYRPGSQDDYDPFAPYNAYDEFGSSGQGASGRGSRARGERRSGPARGRRGTGRRARRGDWE